jgi:hypothetical protein
MSLVVIDGLEDLSGFLTSPLHSATIDVARNGNGIALANNGTGPMMAIPAYAESDTLTVGVAVKYPLVPVGAEVLSLWSDSGATQHNTLQVNNNGSISIRRSSVTLGTSPTGIVVANTWAYIELQIKLHDSAATARIRLNGVDRLNIGGLDTKNAGTKTVYDRIRLGLNSAIGTSSLHDDFYLMTGTGDSFLGDIKVETLYPNGNGNVNQWIGSDGNSVDNYALVDEVPPNVTDWAGSSTAGHQDMYAMTNLAATTASIIAVCHTAHIQKTDSGTRQVKLVNRRAADNKSPARDLTTAFGNVHYMLTTDPETAAPWTIANVNALQSGVETV